MSVRRMMARASAIAALLGAVAALFLIQVGTAAAAPAASAGPAAPSGPADGGGTVSPTAGSPVPAVLARTGLDLTTPIIVGLSILLFGTALVAWAVLRGSRTSGGGGAE